MVGRLRQTRSLKIPDAGGTAPGSLHMNAVLAYFLSKIRGHRGPIIQYTQSKGFE